MLTAVVAVSGGGANGPVARWTVASGSRRAPSRRPVSKVAGAVLAWPSSSSSVAAGPHGRRTERRATLTPRRPPSGTWPWSAGDAYAIGVPRQRPGRRRPGKSGMGTGYEPARGYRVVAVGRSSRARQGAGEVRPCRAVHGVRWVVPFQALGESRSCR
ncbi:MAG: hypothetical protein AVDCRST_MAG49-4719 [uncultured Thermomicrobiales bacterium]|uniref:Uncharacterized protein n=1 Tax=uncultured Thermomicrobiales bacterium TaxID=1645740 RepID=A0A6J4VJ83_9BACT|nr:MAG: hypothetical protein AVDCRST_MAG49-4719 [uncultured Thermomicrobiales bacterium]